MKVQIGVNIVDRGIIWYEHTFRNRSHDILPGMILYFQGARGYAVQQEKKNRFRFRGFFIEVNTNGDNVKLFTTEIDIIPDCVPFTQV